MIERLARWFSGRSTLENSVFGGLLVFCAAPIWTLSQIPTQDGPAHLYNAYLLSGWWKSSFPVDRTIFALNHAPVPNWFSTAILAVFMQLFSPRIAERLLLTLYVVLLPIAFRYASRSFDHIPRYTYFLGFALVWNHLFQVGLFNFCLSLVWYLFFIGYWSRKRASLGNWQILTLFLLSVLLYFSNGLSYYIAAATVGLLSISAFALTSDEIPAEARWRGMLGPQVGLLLALPLSVLYFALHGKNYPTHVSQMTLRYLSWSLTRMSILVPSFNGIDLKLSALFGIVLCIGAGAAFYFRSRTYSKLQISDALFVASACQFVLYAIAPDKLGGVGFINNRLFLYAIVTFALWVAIQKYNKTTIVIISGAAIVVSLGLQVRNFQRNAWLSALLDEYIVSANYIEEHKSLWAFDLDPAGSGYGNARERGLRHDPFEHAGSLLAVERNLVDLNDFEAAIRNFPIVYKDSLDPTKIIERLPRDGGPPTFPPQINIAEYRRATGKPIDYVLLWDVEAQDQTNPAIRSLLQQLSSDYVPVYCAPKVPLRLYRLRELDSPSQLGPNCPVQAAKE